MTVKWKGLLSKSCPLPGGGPLGGTLGIEEYLSQSYNNVDFLHKYKFIDYLSMLAIINLISIRLSSYNCRSHVPSDVATPNLFLDPANTKCQ